MLGRIVLKKYDKNPPVSGRGKLFFRQINIVSSYFYFLKIIFLF
nr:MAG TPA: hypothetical protein [Caudoviricetes sp.]